MDLYTKDIQSVFQVWIYITRIYKLYYRYGFLYQGYTKYIPGMDFYTKDDFFSQKVSLDDLIEPRQ